MLLRLNAAQIAVTISEKTRTNTAMSVRRSLFVLLLLTLIIPVIVFYRRANPPAAVETARQFQEVTVTRDDIEVSVTAIGRIEADRTARASFVGGGRVASVPFTLGDFVLEGDVLAEVENEPQQIAYTQAELAVELAEMQKAQLLEGADEGQIRIAQANIDAARAAAASVAGFVSADEIRALELQVAQSQSALESAQRARTTAPGDQPQAAYDLLEARIGQANFNAEIARLQLEQARTGASGGQRSAANARVAQAQAEFDRLLAGTTPAEIDRADALIAQQRIGLEQAQTALDRTRLTAPFDGVIAAVNIAVDGLALPGVPAVELLDLDPLRLTVQVDEIDIRQIQAGMAARVRVDALPGVELPATLERISLIGTNDAGIVSYDVSVRLDGGDARVRVGMTAEASVVVEARQSVLVAPNAYIRLDRATERAYVNLVRADATLEEVEVTLGLQGQDRSEIVSGVQDGDTIAVDLSGDNIPLFGG
ncbi:MAG: efflux RND transporter periplasmic adaptor subunit [Chloroflexota bacterium]|nr:efflux RND transporter periplasmic adaptor subunit [Chloroflexota bacterium]